MENNQFLNRELNEKEKKEANNAITLHTAINNSEKQAIYEFRYKIFCEELSKSVPLPSNQTNYLTDDLDKQSILLYAKIKSRIIGTLRITIGNANQYPLWLSDIFSLHKIQATLNANQKIGLLTKLAIDSEYRGSTLMYQFLIELLKISYDQNVPYSFGGCNPNLITLYERLGFKRFASKNFIDPGYGLLVPIILITNDSEHFKAVRSPVFRFTRTKNLIQSTSNAILHQIFPFMSKIINSKLIDSIALFNYVNSKFSSKLKDISLFKSLDQKQIIDLLQIGAIFYCNEGDSIINKGEAVRDFYFLITGILSTNTSLLKPGQCFGSYLQNIKHSDNIIAITNAEILVITYQALEKFKNCHPHTANTILKNLTLSQKSLVMVSTNMEESI